MDFKKSIDIFSSRDKIRSQIIELSKNYLKLENFDFAQESYLSYIIDVLSGLTANLMYYNTSVYREQFLTQALQRESVLNLSTMIGYTPELAKPATAQVLISIPLGNFTDSTNWISMKLLGRSNVTTESNTDTYDTQVFRVYSNDIVFSLKNTILLNRVTNDVNTSWNIVQQILLVDDNGNVNPNGWKTIEYNIVDNRIEFIAEFIQLEDITETFTIPKLQPYEFYTFKFPFKKTGYLSDLGIYFVSTSTNEVLEEWTRKNSIFMLAPNEAAFTYREVDTGISISFGNGIIGKQPQSSSVCIASVGLTRGLAGNVISGSIRKSDSIFYVELENTSSTIGTEGINTVSIIPKVVNIIPASGGDNPPSVDEIRSESIKSVSANKRLVSDTDYINMNLIVKDLPIENVFTMLKRSDLKRNEITVFTDIIYNNVIVPTKNLFYTDVAFDNSSNESTYLIKTGEEILEDPDNEDSDVYLSMFDVEINKHTKEATYYYYVSSLEMPVSLIETEKDPLKFSTILPSYVVIYTDRTSDPELLHIRLNTTVLESNIYNCDVTVELDSRDVSTFTMNRKVDPTSNLLLTFTTEAIYDASNNLVSPHIEYPLTNIKEGLITIKFKLYYTSNGKEYYNTSKAEVVVKRNLTDFMYSQVVETSTDGRDGTHSADVDQDYKISSSELNKVISMFNAGSYHNSTETEDGFEEGYGTSRDEFHDADINRDWTITQSELLRIIQFFNAGGYRTTNETTEDGFEVGAPEDTNDRQFIVYDIPCVKKDFYDNLPNKLNFNKEILNRIINFDVYSYKMLTDFVNLKFANTYGFSKNMLLNTKSKRSVKDIDLKTLPSNPIDGDRYAISNINNNPWKTIYDNNYENDTIANILSYDRKTGFIAEYFTDRVINDTSQATGWLFETLYTNDMFEVTTYGGENINKTFIYNGTSFEEPIVKIPFKIKMTVFSSLSSGISDAAIRQNIVDKLIDTFADKFGYQKNIYVSQITKAVQEVTGVRNCIIHEPKHDIFFDFDPDKDLTPEQLIKFTPELIYFTANNISIDIKSSNII